MRVVACGGIQPSIPRRATQASPTDFYGLAPGSAFALLTVLRFPSERPHFGPYCVRSTVRPEITKALESSIRWGITFPFAG